MRQRAGATALETFPVLHAVGQYFSVLVHQQPIASSKYTLAFFDSFLLHVFQMGAHGFVN